MKRDRNPGRTLLRRVFARYGWLPDRVKRIRGAWRVETANGTFALKKAACPPEKLPFLHRMVEEARSVGVDAVLPWVSCRDGRPFVEDEGGAWYATPWYGEVLDSRDSLPAEELIRQLAVFHRIMEKPAETAGKYRYRAGPDLVERWKKHREMAEAYGIRLKSREFVSPFEQMLSDHADLLDKAFSFAIRGMERFVETEDGVPPRFTFCHGRLHPSNILQGDEGWKWIDWDHAQVDSPVRDLVTVFRHVVKPSEAGERLLPLLAVYEQERELSRKEKKLLALYLAYPERAFKLLHRYGDGTARLEEAEAVRRLREEMEALRRLQEPIGELWPKRSAPKRGSKGSRPVKAEKSVAAIRSHAATRKRES